MKFFITKSWVNAIQTIKNKPLVFLPFITIAFVELIILELVYFSSRNPIGFVARPLIKKFFGEPFNHYPLNLTLLPKTFYFIDVIIYIFISLFLMGVSINVFKNINSNLPVKLKAVWKNIINRYPAIVLYGILMIALSLLLRKIDVLFLSKVFKVLFNFAPNRTSQFFPFLSPLFLFITNIIIQALLVLALPILVLMKKSFFSSLVQSIYLGIKNFFKLFIMISIPYLVYLPIFLLKTFSVKVIDLTFPEITFYITAFGILISAFVDYMIVICASQFVMGMEHA